VHEFSVWAPSASGVEVQVGDRRHAMAADGGWWRAAVPEAGPGSDYAFVLDGGQPLPDPRSAWQPAGVHGPSRVFDAGAHVWRDGDWAGLDVLGRVFYELHVGTFTPEGTLDAAAGRLDHLVDLGVDVVELMPLAAFPGERGWGYDGVHLYAVHDPYGGPAALQRFVDECHARGLAVCLDVVYNHLGPEGNYLGRFGPYFTGRHHTPWGEAVNLDAPGSAEVRRWICDNALRWFADFHVDCLRLDAVHALVDDSPRHVLAQLSDEVAALSGRLGRPLSLVAESDLNDPVMIEPTAAGGRGMTAQWDDDVHHALHTLLTGERQGYYVDFGTTDVVRRVFTEAFRHAGGHSTFRGRPWGVPIDPARHRGHRFVACLQNHDQVGNRAAGDRLSATLSPARLAAGAALVLTSPFTPMLFMGEEWGATTPWQFFTSYPDPALADAVRKGRREEFSRHGWRAEDVPDPQARSTRDASVLRWDEPGSGDHARLLAWYRDLVALRRREPDLRDDDLRRVRVDVGETWLAVRRGAFHVLVNLGDRDAVLPAPPGATPVLAWGAVEVLGAAGVRVAADATAVVRTTTP
jgi:maltooligosyltrehalose trehalohydrolase